MHIQKFSINNKSLIVIKQNESFYEVVIVSLKKLRIKYFIDKDSDVNFYAKDLNTLVTNLSDHYAYSSVRFLIARLLLLKMQIEGKHDDLIKKFTLEIDTIQKAKPSKLNHQVVYKEEKDSETAFNNIIEQFKLELAARGKDTVSSVPNELIDNLTKKAQELQNDTNFSKDPADLAGIKKIMEEIDFVKSLSLDVERLVRESNATIDTIENESDSFPPELTNLAQQDISNARFKGNLFSYALLRVFLQANKTAFEETVRQNKKAKPPIITEKLKQIFDFTNAEDLTDEAVKSKLVDLFQALRQTNMPRLLRDPIILSTGITCERADILNQDKSYKVTECPVTHTMITSYHDNIMYQGILKTLHNELATITTHITEQLDLDMLRTCIDLGLSARFDLIVDTHIKNKILIMAIIKNEFALTKLLIENEKFPVNITTINGENCLNTALQQKELSMIKLIFKNLTTIDDDDINGLLAWAASSGNVDIIANLTTKNKIKSLSEEQQAIIINSAIAGDQIPLALLYIQSSNLLKYYGQLISNDTTQDSPELTKQVLNLFISLYNKQHPVPYNEVMNKLIDTVKLLQNSKALMRLVDLIEHDPEWEFFRNEQAQTACNNVRKGIKLHLLRVANQLADEGDRSLLNKLENTESEEGKFINTKLKHEKLYKILESLPLPLKFNSTSVDIAQNWDPKERKRLLDEQSEKFYSSIKNTR